jgi:threonine dehydrogenase-like Zn-dependent dehydrogenase
MPSKMKAALDDGTGKYVLHEVDMPQMFEGAALIKVRQSGICGSDLHMTDSRTEAQEIASGHEVAGEVLELPAGETRLKVGDRVALETIGAGRACMQCHYCRYGQYRHCMDLLPDTGGGFAEYMTRKPSGLFKLPDNLDWVDGALVEPMAVSVHALRYVGMKPGDVIGVTGSSTIGLSAIAAAHVFGAKKVIASAKYAHQAEAARKMGADVVTASDGDEFEEACREASGGIGADIVLESVGGHQTAALHQAIRSTRPQGKVVNLGGLKAPMEIDLFDPLLREIAINSVSCYDVIDGIHDYEVAIDILASGAVPYREIVTHQNSLDDIQSGFATAYDKNSGSIKVHITQ